MLEEERKLGSVNPFFVLDSPGGAPSPNEKAPLPYATPFFTRGSTTELKLKSPKELKREKIKAELHPRAGVPVPAVPPRGQDRHCALPGLSSTFPGKPICPGAHQPSFSFSFLPSCPCSCLITSNPSWDCSDLAAAYLQVSEGSAEY